MKAKVKKVWLPETALPPTKEYHNGKPRTALFVPLSMESYRESNERGREIARRNRGATKQWTEEEVQRATKMRESGMIWKDIGKEFGVSGDAVKCRVNRKRPAVTSSKP